MKSVFDNVFEDGRKRQNIDIERLADGELVFVLKPTFEQITAEVWFRPTGIRFADEKTWKEWRLHPTLLLWQAVALSLHLDPDSITWRQFETRSGFVGLRSVGELLTERAAQAARHAASGILPCVELAPGDPERSTVTLWQFAQWSDQHEIPCPVNIPREAQPIKPAAKSLVAPANRKSKGANE